MEAYIRSLTREVDALISSPPPQMKTFVEVDRNYPFRHSPDVNYCIAQDMSLHGTRTGYCVDLDIRQTLQSQLTTKTEQKTRKLKRCAETKVQEV